jgi:hypothetical protein
MIVENLHGKQLKNHFLITQIPSESQNICSDQNFSGEKEFAGFYSIMYHPDNLRTGKERAPMRRLPEK